VSLLLSVAETVVESGAVRAPLEYYQELANQSPPWIAGPESDPVPSVKLYQICSPGVKRLTAALGLCLAGARSDRGETVHIVLLLSAPDNAVPSSLSLLAQAVRVLGPRSWREALLESRTPQDAWALLCRLESQPAYSPRS